MRDRIVMSRMGVKGDIYDLVVDYIVLSWINDNNQMI